MKINTILLVRYIYVTYICSVIIKQLEIMKNLLNTLSQELRSKLSDFKVSFVGIDVYKELNVRSEYDMDFSFYTAIENELKTKGFEIC